MTILPEIGKHYQVIERDVMVFEGVCTDIVRTPAGTDWDFYATFNADDVDVMKRITSRAVTTRRTPQPNPPRTELPTIPDAEAMYPGGEDA